MRPRSLVVACAAASLLLSCSDHSQSADPTAPDLESEVHAAAAAPGGGTRPVLMMDACDAESFNTAIGPGTCARPHGLLFDKFIRLLGEHHSVGAWRFAPATINAKVGQTLLAVNRGGEVHTFTEVQAFGGGIVPELNALAGTPVPAPECLALQGGDFVPPGGSYTEEVDQPGTRLYECCLHPWMRAAVTAP